MNPRAIKLLEQKRLVVVCGAGGVGKTSVSAAIALAAARRGRRVLVVTIDPSRRLAEVLGVSRQSSKPLPIPAHLREPAGIEPPGALEAWMLDPKHVADEAVRRLAGSEHDAQRLLRNAMYRNITEMVAGMQEYTAAEAVHQFVKEGTYDLVILDTPPSRNALDFLDSSVRLGRLFDGRVFQLFLPGDRNPIRRAARKLLVRIMDIALEPDTRQELEDFLGLFSAIFSRLNANASDIHAFFSRPEVAFLIVTSPAKEALQEAYYFEDKTQISMGLQLEGYVLNRSLAYKDERELPSLDHVDGAADDSTVRSALEKLRVLGLREQAQADHDRELHRSLARKGGSRLLAVALPYLENGMEDIHSLVRLADAFVDARAGTPT